MTAVAEKIEKTVAEKMRDGDLLTLEEASGPLGVKGHWGVRNLIDHHGLPFVRVGGRGKRIDPVDLREWKQKRREIVTF